MTRAPPRPPPDARTHLQPHAPTHRHEPLVTHASLPPDPLQPATSPRWAAGVYPLSLLIALLSGLWPYVKLLLMLACWWAPASWLPPRRCELLLRVLDGLGKVDNFRV